MKAKQQSLDALRAAEKKAAREADVRAVEAGERSGAQVNGENSLAANISPFDRDKSGLGVRR
jgi:hypothetical protein